MQQQKIINKTETSCLYLAKCTRIESLTLKEQHATKAQKVKTIWGGEINVVDNIKIRQREHETKFSLQFQNSDFEKKKMNGKVYANQETDGWICPYS